MTQLPGLPGYEVRGRLGRGETGVVVAAWQTHLERLCAIKELAPRLAQDTGFRERFREEARILATFDHPHIVRVYDYVEAEAAAYLVMECVEGASLQAVLRRAGRLTPEQSLGLLEGALEGLGHAHAAGVLHRDLIPPNVLVDGQGVSKLTDFGLEVGSSAATAAYRSPEQRRGDALDPRSDIYSCGAIVYECLTGHHPAGPGSDPRTRLATLPEAVAGMVSRTMAEDPAQRPADTAALRAELEAVAGEAYGEDWRRRAALLPLVGAAIAAGGGLTAALGGASAGGAATGAAAATEAGATVAGAVTAPPPPPPPAHHAATTPPAARSSVHGDPAKPHSRHSRHHHRPRPRIAAATGALGAVIVAVVVFVAAGHHGTGPGPLTPSPINQPALPTRVPLEYLVLKNPGPRSPGVPLQVELIGPDGTVNATLQLPHGSSNFLPVQGGFDYVELPPAAVTGGVAPSANLRHISYNGTVSSVGTLTNVAVTGDDFAAVNPDGQQWVWSSLPASAFGPQNASFTALPTAIMAGGIGVPDRVLSNLTPPSDGGFLQSYMNVAPVWFADGTVAVYIDGAGKGGAGGRVLDNTFGIGAADTKFVNTSSGRASALPVAGACGVAAMLSDGEVACYAESALLDYVNGLGGVPRRLALPTGPNEFGHVRPSGGAQIAYCSETFHVGNDPTRDQNMATHVVNLGTGVDTAVAAGSCPATWLADGTLVLETPLAPSVLAMLPGGSLTTIATGGELLAVTTQITPPGFLLDPSCC
jgi:serine/threonine protein kinase